MKKMVITGVNGFIGRHAKEYFEKEYEITGLDLAANYCGDRQPGDTMTYYQCNMSQESAEMAAIFTGVQPDVILHCAGSANVGASVVNPMADLDGNLHSLYQLLLALKSFEKRPQIIFLSSAGIYGNPRQLPVRESDAAAPMSPYGLHKHMAEELCEYYNRIHGYRIRSIRIFSAYGNGLRKQLLWDIYQKYQNTGRIGELAEIYAGKLGADADVVSFNGMVKEGDPRNWRADISLLKKLGYEKHMALSDGIEAYVEWAREQE